MGDKDQLFSEPYSHIKAFAFDEKVVAVFPDMIKRSVPGYDTILKGTAMLAMNHIQPKTQVYDLGASLGAVSLTIDQAIGPQSVHIHAVDNSPPMIDSLTEHLSAVQLHNRIEPHCADVAGFPMAHASMVVSNFTLQFMPVASRAGVCEAIFQALNPGGVFVLSEKIQSSQTMIDYYHGYKKVNGYSDMEIAQKRQALEDSLQPDTLEAWQQRLRQAGFQHIEVWFKAFNFVSLVATK